MLDTLKSDEVVSVIIGVGLAFLIDWITTRRRRRGHLLALKAELEYCRDLASTYLKGNVIAPLYRLPTIAYANSLPALLSTGTLGTDAKVLIGFFNEVETFNRGLDQAENSRSVDAGRNQDVKLNEEYERNKLKAARIASDEAAAPTYYDHAYSVIELHLRWYKL